MHKQEIERGVVPVVGGMVVCGVPRPTSVKSDGCQSVPDSQETIAPRTMYLHCTVYTYNPFIQVLLVRPRSGTQVHSVLCVRRLTRQSKTLAEGMTKQHYYPFTIKYNAVTNNVNSTLTETTILEQSIL